MVNFFGIEIFGSCLSSISVIFLGETNLTYWSMGKSTLKIQLIGWSNHVFSFQFLGMTFWKERIIFFCQQRRKTSYCFSTVYLFLCDKIEEHPWKIKWNWNQIIFILLYNNLEFSINCLNILHIKNKIKHWMAHISMEGD